MNVGGSSACVVFLVCLSLFVEDSISSRWNLEKLFRRQRILEGVHIFVPEGIHQLAGLFFSSPLLFSFSDLKNQLSRIISGFCDCA